MPDVRRQPGSAFKPFVYAAAIDAGDSPGTVLANLNDPVLTPEGAWVPEDEHSTADEMTLRTALRMNWMALSFPSSGYMSVKPMRA